MSSLDEIIFNYEQALSEAGKLEDLASRLSNAAWRDMEQILNECSSAWRGDYSSKYIQKGQKVEHDLDVVAGNVRNIASAVRENARRALEAEMEAWRIANERTN